MNHSLDKRVRITVITVCRNALEELKLTAASVSEQTMSDVLHVVVDGASTDGTVDWLNAHADQFAVAISEPDNGIYDAMNKALALCPPSDWIVFMNAGDRFFDRDVLQRLAQHLTRDDIDFLFGHVQVEQKVPSRAPKTYAARPHARLEMPGCHQACFVRAELMQRLRFQAGYKVAADFECWLRATRQFGSRTGTVDQVIATIAPEGFSALNEPALQREYAQAIRTHINPALAVYWLGRRKLRMLSLHLRGLFRERFA